MFGFSVEYKTHAKLSIVVRREGEALRTYCHFGTGNYHPQTAKNLHRSVAVHLRPRAGAGQRQTVQLHHWLRHAREAWTGWSFSPVTMKADLLKLIAAEAANAQARRPAAIWAKLNSVVDPVIIDALYRASQAGVRIELVVRGICCLRPGIPGLSDNIRVKSIVGRFLEHARIVAFANGHELPSAHARVFISSADWMPRNLDRRVESLVPVENPTVHQQVLTQIMVANINDVAQSWNLDGNGQYRRAPGWAAKGAFSAHQYFMTNPSLSGRGQKVKDLPRAFEHVGAKR